MTARTAVALALAAAAMLAALVARVMAWSVLAGTLLACVLAMIIGGYLTWRAIGTGGGAHAAPRGWNDGLRPLPVAGRVIPRAAVEGRPPWDDQPPPDGYIVAVLLPLAAQETRPALPAYAEQALGHRTVDAALDSIFTRAMTRQVNELIRGDSP